MRLLFIICCAFFILPLRAQVSQDTTAAAVVSDSLRTPYAIPDLYKTLTDSNFLLNVKGIPAATVISYKKINKETTIYFYITAALLLILGILKTFFPRYFNTLFRVFFNTSLRQNQLTDQLEQAKLPSLIFNIFFILAAGLYLCLILRYYGMQRESELWKLFGLCTVALGFCYFIKFITLRLIGWVTNFMSEAGMYIFIVFLHNKIAGILLLPFIIILAFSSKTAAAYAVLSSGLVFALIILMRFYRSYSVLHSKLKISGFHFLLYILAFEVIPVAIVYKTALLFLSINT